jgi:hypothetical protein
MKGSRIEPGELKGLIRYEQRHRERAAGEMLAIGAVAGVDNFGDASDLVAKASAQASTGLWKVHLRLPPEIIHNQRRRGGP